MYHHIFGPVASRRLGRSLGVDLVLPKICSYDCLFCQVGRTTRETLERRDYVPVAKVVAELEDWVRGGGQADCITLAGAGEPTLHAHFGEVIEAARRLTGARVALLSNGSLFHLPVVREEAARADIVKVSLSAWDDESFGRINRPVEGLLFAEVLDGMRAFRGQFQGELWLEVMLLEGLNDAPVQVSRIAALARTIRPDCVQLNTVVRPPADPSARGVAASRLDGLAGLFDPPAEVIASFRGRTGAGGAVSMDAVVSAVSRHPSTVEELAQVFDVPAERVRDLVHRLEIAGRVRCHLMGERAYYEAAPEAGTR